MRVNRRIGLAHQAVALAALASAALFSPLAFAAYPDHPINVVVPFGPGGPTDVIARLIAPAMGKELGETLVILNKPGAAGNIGAGFLATAKPDGYTVMFTGTAATQNPAVYRNLPYDPQKDLVPVAMFATSPFVIAVNAEKVAAKTVSELIAMIRASPGKFNIATTGGQQMTVQRFLIQHGLNVEIVAYKSGGEAVLGLIRGEADFEITDANQFAPGVASGKVRMLAVASDKRLPSLPDLPTTREQGVEYYDQTFVGLYVPARTPPDIIAALHAAASKAIATPEVRDRLQGIGYTPVQKSQAEFDAFYRADIATWKDIVTKAKIPFAD